MKISDKLIFRQNINFSQTQIFFQKMNNNYQGYAEACGRGANTGIITGAVAWLVVSGGGFVQGMIDYESRNSQGRTGSERYTLGLNDR